MRFLSGTVVVCVLVGPAIAQVNVVQRQISGPMVTGGRVSDFVVQDGRVVYRADQDVDDLLELYAAPADGSAPAVKLSTPVSGGDVDHAYSLSPDGSTVVYRATARFGHLELFSAPYDGSAAPVRLNGNLSFGGNVHGAKVSPDSQHVVFVSDEIASPGYRLRAVPIHGGPSVPLRSVYLGTDVVFTPDSSSILFVDSELWLVAIDGSSSLALSTPAVSRFKLSDDGTRVLFTASTPSGDRLYVAPPVDAPVELSGSMVSGSDVKEFAFSPDGQRAVYIADAFTFGNNVLFSVPLDGSAQPTELSGPIVGGGDVYRFELTPDGASVVYQADQEINEVFRLHRVPLDGSAPDVMLSTFDLDGAAFPLTADGAYAVNIHVAGGLRAQPVAGGEPILIDSDVVDAALSEGGRRVFYLNDDRVRLASITGGPALDLNPTGGAFPPLALDGKRVLYRAQGVDGAVDLFVSWLERGPVQDQPPVATRSMRR